MAGLDDFAEQARQELLRRKAAEAKPAPQVPTGMANPQAMAEVGGSIDAALLGAHNAMSLGFGDNLRGLGSGIGGLVSGEGFGPAYARGRDETRALYESAQDNYPGSYLAGQVAGSIPAGAGMAPELAGKGVLASIPRMAAFGAAEGGLYGAGEANGENVLANAGIGAALGGGLGAAAVPAVAGVRALGRGAGGIVEALSGRPSQSRAGGVIARAMDRAGMGVDDVRLSVAQALADGQPMYRVADALGPSGARSLSGVARQPGAARQEIIDFLEGRQAGQADRIGGFLTEALGTPDTAAQREARLIARRGDIANVNYEAARQGAQPVDVRGALDAIDNIIGPYEAGPVGTDATGGVLRGFRDRLRVPDGKLPDGVSAMELSDFDAVLKVKKDLGDEIEVARRAGRNNAVREMMQVQQQLDAALEAASGGYRAANDTFRNQSRVIDAIGEGRNAARPGREADALNAYRALPQSTLPVPAGEPAFDTARAAFRSGYADPLMARIENAAPGVNKARPLLSPKNRAMMDEMAQDPTMFSRRLDRENAMFETRNAAMGGSRTADNLADQTDVAGSVLPEMLVSPKQTTISAATRAFQDAMSSAGEQTRLLVARALLSADPEAALRPLLRKEIVSQAQMRAAESVVRALGRENLQ